MLPKPRNYAIYPSVVPADKQINMTIVPNEKAFLLFEGEEYRIAIVPIESDVSDYATWQTAQYIDAKAHNGILSFPFIFDGEQEHLVVLFKGEQKLQEMAVYSLREDLYSLRVLKGDLHAHSHRSDGKRDPAALMGHFREQGYDFLALTDHNRFYPGGEIDETYDGVKLGIFRVTGEEVHTPPTPVHIVHIGGATSVTAQYIKHPEEYQNGVKECLNKVPKEIPEQYKERYAMAMWACDRIHEAGGVAIFPHPYWRTASRAYNVNTEFAEILLKSGMFDAYELVGGMGQTGVNLSVALWTDLRATGLNISVVGSSDVHALERSVNFPDHFTLCFAIDKTNDAVADAVKAGNSIAVEATGTEYDRHFRCYGTHRLVSYAQFLLKYYFPERERMCQGEGVAMRTYAMGDAKQELIELQVEQTEKFEDRFFGRIAPALPSDEIIAFEDKWREVHVAEGPITKGSRIYSDTVTRQI